MAGAPAELIQRVPLFSDLDPKEVEQIARSFKERVFSPGDHFGEIALIDAGARSATIIADTELRCYGITSWEFRPLVELHGTIAWKLLETMARMLRAAQERHG